MKRSKEGRFLEIIIKGSEKEIADLVLRLQGQQNSQEIRVVKKITAGLREQLSSSHIPE